MARFRNLRPVNSDKKETTWSNIGQNASAGITIPIITVTSLSATNTGAEASVGSRIQSMFFEFHFSAAQTGNVNVVHWRVVKVPAGMPITEANTYYQLDRSKTLKRGMEMLPVNVTTVFKRIFVIPSKMFRRLSEGDTVTLEYIASSTQTINACGFVITKVLR